MMNQPLAVLPGGFEVRQSFVPSVGAAQYSPSDPLELLQMCSGLYEMWKRITDMYPFNVRMEERPVWDNQMWESRSGTAFAMFDWMREEYVICRLRRSSEDSATASVLAKVKLYLLMCEVRMATLGVVGIHRRIQGIPVGANRVAVSQSEWYREENFDRDIDRLPRHHRPHVVVSRMHRRASF
jgi:hypothetical protein